MRLTELTQSCAVRQKEKRANEELFVPKIRPPGSGVDRLYGRRITKDTYPGRFSKRKLAVFGGRQGSGKNTEGRIRNLGYILYISICIYTVYVVYVYYVSLRKDLYQVY